MGALEDRANEGTLHGEKPARYVVTVTEVVERLVMRNTWQFPVATDQPRGDYVPNIQPEEAVREVYRQELDTIDLPNLVRTINQAPTTKETRNDN